MIKRITLHNCQSIPYAVFDFPETGVVRLQGRNGSGKSIIPKWIDDVLKGDITILKARKPLIMKKQSSGDMQIDLYNGKHLLVVLSIEASRTYMEYWEDFSTVKLRRYLSDGKEALQDLVRKMGFHFNENRKLSLNMYPTFGDILYLTTSPVVNFDVSKDAIQDDSVDKAIINDKIFIQNQEVAISQVEDNITRCKDALLSLSFFDEVEEQSVYDLCLRIANTISAIKDVSIEELSGLPDISFLNSLDNIPNIDTLPQLPNVSFLDALRVENIVTELDKKMELSDNIVHCVNIIDSIPEIPNLIEIKSNLKRVQNTVEILESLSTIPAVDTLNASVERVDKIVRALSVLEKLPDVPELEPQLLLLNKMYTSIENKICEICGTPIKEALHCQSC